MKKNANFSLHELAYSTQKKKEKKEEKEEQQCNTNHDYFYFMLPNDLNLI